MSRLPAAQTAVADRAVARPVSRPHDAAEREADRAAEVVAAGGQVRHWSLSAAPPAAGAVQRDNGKDDEKKSAEDPNRKEYEEAAKKTGEALLKTEAGKALEKQMLESPPVKKLKEVATSPAGIAIGATAVAGGVAGLALAGKELPFQPPTIPLDFITPGLSVDVKVTGPLNAPTFVGLTVTFRPKAKDKEKPRAAREGQQAGPRAPQRSATEEQALSEAAIDYAVRQMTARHPLGTPVMQLDLSPRGTKGTTKTTDEEPVQRAPDHATTDHAGAATARVDDGFEGAGRPLDDGVRRTMEQRFGQNFSSVRLHDDTRATAASGRVDARAFTVGEHVVLGRGQGDPSSHLLAHELAHVVQNRHGREGRSTGAAPVHRQPRSGTTSTTATTEDRQSFVDAAIRYLQASTDHWRAVARIADAPRPGGAPRTGRQDDSAPAATPAQAPSCPSGLGRLDPERLRTVLQVLLDTYDNSRRVIDGYLGGDPDRQARLQVAYVAATEAARSAAASSGRVNLVLVAAPKGVGDAFIVNATRYAELYFSRAQIGDTVQQVTDVDSPAALFDAIETAAPDRMMRRIDIFAHGTIEPTHQIKFGTSWFTIAELEAAAATRSRTGVTLRSQTRFDGSTTIELHACRLGAATSQPGQHADTPTSGTDFLSSFGMAAGGARGHQVVGYEQRWAPRRFSIPGIDSSADVGTTGRRAQAFDDMAVRIWDTAMAGGIEAQSQLTDAERQPNAVLARDRKVEIMRRLYDEGGGAWLIGHQYSGASPQSSNPVRDVRRGRDTFSNEADWGHRVLRITVPTPTPAGGAP